MDPILGSFNIFVKLGVHFVSVCLKVQKWILTDTKVTFQPPNNLHKTFLKLKYITHFLFYGCIKGGKDYPSMISFNCLSFICLSVFFFFLSETETENFCITVVWFAFGQLQVAQPVLYRL